MTVTELILINSDKVRRDSSLMAFYIQYFIEAFGYKPVCTGCSFSSDWTKLVRYVTTGVKEINQRKNIMSNTFKLKKSTNTILRYEVEGKVIRKYDNLMTEEFAIGFLTNGSKEEIENRKKLFTVLPDAINGGKKEQAIDKDENLISEKVTTVKAIKSKKQNTKVKK